MGLSPAKGESMHGPKRAVQSPSQASNFEPTSTKKKQQDALIESHQLKWTPPNHVRQDAAPTKKLQGKELQVRRQSLRPSLSAPASVARTSPRPPSSQRPLPLTKHSSAPVLAAPRPKKQDLRARSTKFPECSNARDFYFSLSPNDNKENDIKKYIYENRKEAKKEHSSLFVTSYPRFKGEHVMKTDENNQKGKQKMSTKRQDTLIPNIETISQILSKNIRKKELEKISSTDIDLPKGPLLKTGISQREPVYQSSTLTTQDTGHKGSIGVSLPKTSRSKTFIVQQWPVPKVDAVTNENVGANGSSRAAAHSKASLSNSSVAPEDPIRMLGGSSNGRDGGGGLYRASYLSNASHSRTSIDHERSIRILGGVTDEVVKVPSRIISFSNTSLHEMSIAQEPIRKLDLTDIEDVGLERSSKFIDHTEASRPMSSSFLERLSRSPSDFLPVERAGGENSYWNIGLPKAKLPKPSINQEESIYPPGSHTNDDARAERTNKDKSLLKTQLRKTSEGDFIYQLNVVPSEGGRGEVRATDSAGGEISYDNIGVSKAKLLNNPENTHRNIGLPKAKLSKKFINQEKPILMLGSHPNENAKAKGTHKDISLIKTQKRRTTQEGSIFQPDVLNEGSAGGENAFNTDVPISKLPQKSAVKEQPTRQRDRASTDYVRGKNDGRRRPPGPVMPPLLREKPLDPQRIVAWKAGRRGTSEGRCPGRSMKCAANSYVPPRCLKVM